MFGADWIAVDIETTGFNRQQDRIIELAAIRFDPQDRGKPLDRFHFLCNPGCKVSPGASKVNGFTDDEVRTYPPLITGMIQFAGWLAQFDRPVLCAHHVAHDRDYVDRQAHRQGLVWPHRNWFCTLVASRALFPQRDKHTLSSVHRFLCLPAGAPEPIRHRAMADAEAHAEVASVFLTSSRVVSFDSLRAWKAIL